MAQMIYSLGKSGKQIGQFYIRMGWFSTEVRINYFHNFTGKFLIKTNLNTFIPGAYFVDSISLQLIW